MYGAIDVDDLQPYCCHTVVRVNAYFMKMNCLCIGVYPCQLNNANPIDGSETVWKTDLIIK